MKPAELLETLDSDHYGIAVVDGETKEVVTSLQLIKKRDRKEFQKLVITRGFQHLITDFCRKVGIE